MLVSVALLALTGLLLLVTPGILPSSPVYGAPVQQAAPALVSAASGVLPLGGVSVTLPVSVSNVVNLGSITAQVGYDRTVIAPVACRVNRTAFQTTLCNLAFDSNTDGAPDSVRFALITLSSVSAPANAPLVMVEISWVATGTAAVGMTSPLTVTVFDPAGPDGVAMPPFATQHGQIVIAAAPPPTATPEPSATPVDTATSTPLPTATSTPIPTPLTTPESTPTTPTSVERPAAVFLPVVASP